MVNENLLYLVEKQRSPIEFETFVTTIGASDNYRVEPLCVPIIRQCSRIPRDDVPDPWDRLIAATSLQLKVPLISRDQTLRQARLAGLQVVW